MRRSDYIFQSFSLRERINLSNVILSTTNSNQKFLPPGLSACEHEFLYYAYVDIDPRTDFNVNAVWLGGGPPPASPTRLNDIVNDPDWNLELSAPGFNPQLEGFVANVGRLYIIHYKPGVSPIDVFTIRAIANITNVTPSSISIEITGLIDNVNGPALNYFGNNAFYLCQVFTPDDTPVVYALQNNNVTLQTSPLSGLDFDIVHNNHITVTHFVENIVYQNTPNTPDPNTYNDPLGPISINYIRVFARYAHFYSIRNSIDWINSINYPGLYNTTLYIKFFPNKQDPVFVIEDTLITYYPNQDQTLAPRPPFDRLNITINNVGLCSITRVGNVPFPTSNVYVYVLVLFDEADHALNSFPPAYNFVLTFTASSVSPTEYQTNLPLNLLSILNRPYKVVAGMFYLETSLNRWASVFSEPKDPPRPSSETGRFDVVFIGSSNRVGGLNIPITNLSAHSKTALSARYSVFNDPVIKFPPHDSIYVNGLIITRRYTTILSFINPAWTNATAYFNDFLRSFHNGIVNRAARLVYKLYGEDILGNRTLVYTYSSTFNRVNQLNYYAFTSGGVFAASFTFLNSLFKHTYLQDRRPVVSPLPLNAPTYYSLFSNNPAWNTFISHPNLPASSYFHTLGYHTAVFSSPQATEIRAAVGFMSNASIRMLTNFTLTDASTKTFALLFTIAVPLPRYINSFFYKQDRAPFETDFTTDFVRTVHVLELYDNANTLMYTGEQVSLLNHQYEVDEPNLNLKTLSVLDYEPLRYWQLSLDTTDVRQYSYTCTNNNQTVVVTLYQNDVSENNIIDVVYWNVADIPLLLNQQFNTVYPQANVIIVHSPDHTIPVQMANKISSNILSFDSTTNTLTIDKTKLNVGRYYIYFRGFHENRKIDFYEFDYDYNPNQCTNDQFAGYYELDSFRILPPPPDYDLSGIETDCKYGFMYLCEEQVRVFTAFQMTDLPQGTQELVFLDQFEQPKYYLYIFPSASVACGYSTKDWCGVEIVENFPRDTITIRYNVRGRIDDVEVYSDILPNDKSYECLSRFQGVLDLDTDTVEEEQYITSITKEKRTIFRRYTLEYTLTLYLPNACALGHLLLIKKAQYWIVESQNFYAFRVKVLPGEIQYRSLDGQKYLAIIKLREIRYPGEYRYPLR